MNWPEAAVSIVALLAVFGCLAFLVYVVHRGME